MYKKLLAIILIISPIFLMIVQKSVASAENLNVHFINVDQGDSILVETPENKYLLIDGGPPESKQQLINYLKKERIDHLDLMIATHPDIDHIGGLVEVLNQLDVEEVMYPDQNHHTKTYKRFHHLLKEKKVNQTKIKEDIMIEIEKNVVFHFMNTIPLKKKRSNNEASLVIQLIHEEINFLFMADVGIEEEKFLMKQYDLESSILKVGHHGSKTSSGRHFIQTVNPKVSIFTYGRNNKYGHPVKRVVQNLLNINANIYSTATHGNILIKSDGSSYFILVEKSPLDELSNDAS